MKKCIITLASVLMLIACQKASTDTNTTKEQPIDKAPAVTLKAIMPGFGTETKATISDTGNFSWVDGENADIITVRYTKEGADDEFVLFSCTDAEESEFTGNPPSDYSIATSGMIAFYPADYRGTPSAYSGTAANASKSFQMKATSFDDGKLSFEHDNALLKISIKDIPSIADNIVIGYKDGYSTVTLSEGGDLSVMVPAITSGEDKLHIYVKRGDDVLFTKATKKGVEIKKGYLYTHIPELTVAPEAVYLKSSMTNWAEDIVAPMTLDEGIYTLSLNSIGNQFATVYVKWNGSYVKMGPETDQSTTASQALTPCSNAVKLSNLGAYTFTFDPVTSSFTFDKTSDVVPFYVFGSENEWSLTDTSMPLNNLTLDGKYYLIGQKGQYKIRYNNYEASSFGYGSSASGSTGVYVFGPSNTGSSSLIISIPADGSGITYEYFDESQSDSGETSVKIVDYVNGANNCDLTQDTYNKKLWTTTKKFTDNTTYNGTRIKFRINDNGSGDWGMGDNVEYGSMGSSDNNTFWVQANTYLVVLNTSTGKIKFLRMPTSSSGEDMTITGTEYNI